jgi:hypothetical protein
VPNGRAAMCNVAVSYGCEGGPCAVGSKGEKGMQSPTCRDSRDEFGLGDGYGAISVVVSCGSVRIAATRAFGSSTGTCRCFHLQPCTSSYPALQHAAQYLVIYISSYGNILKASAVGPLGWAKICGSSAFPLSVSFEPPFGPRIRRRFIAPSRTRSLAKSSWRICNNSKDAPGLRSRQQCLILQRPNWLKTVSRSAGTTLTG